MEVLRFSNNIWGQKIIQGASWDLIPIFFFFAVAVIIIHAFFNWLLKKR